MNGLCITPSPAWDRGNGLETRPRAKPPREEGCSPNLPALTGILTIHGGEEVRESISPTRKRVRSMTCEPRSPSAPLPAMSFLNLQTSGKFGSMESPDIIMLYLSTSYIYQPASEALPPHRSGPYLCRDDYSPSKQQARQLHSPNPTRISTPSLKAPHYRGL